MSNQSKRYQKFVATAAAATLVASAMPIAASAAYSDVPSSLKKAVDYLTAQGIAQGYNDSTFGVSDSIKRGDAAKMIATAVGLNSSTAPKSPFKDLNSRVEGAVNALYAAGIINGKTKTTFAPDELITRAEMAKILANAYKLDGAGVKNTFTDVNDHWDSYVNALLKSGLTKGKTATTFGANVELTRGDMALFIYRAKDLVTSDKEAPTLTYTGSTNIEVAYSSKFTLPVVTAKDNKDANVAVTTTIRNSNGVVITEIDTTKSGKYTITYSAQDKAGNKATNLVITVTVASQVVVPPVDPPVNPPVDPKPFTLSLMHTNDTHAHLDNVAKRITAIKEVRAVKPDALLLDAGDVFSGTLYFNEFKGQADLEFMNLAKYDLMTLGNHEFDLGSTPEGHQALAEFIEGADFPIVSSNVNFSADDNLKDLYKSGVAVDPKGGAIHNAVIKNVGGQKVGFIGLTTEETAEISSANDVTFKNYIDSANAAVDALEAQGVNKIVALSHLGFDDNPAFDNDQLLAANVDGIDVIVGGHSHTQLNAPVISNKDENGKAKDPTIIVQGYQYGDFLGTLDVTFNKDGVVTGNAGSLIKVADKVEDEAAAALLAPYSEQIATVKNTETGATAVTVLDNPRSTTDNVRANETRLGNLIADGMLWKAKQFNENAVIAMQNGGGIRAPIDAGPITLGDVLTTLPFGNTLATMTLSGAEIKAALEHSVSQSPKESGGFLHISGMKFKYDNSLAAGKRVTSMKVKNTDGSFTDIKLDANYVVATNAFTAKGGDGFDVFKNAYEAGRVTDLGAADWENLRDYVKELGTVDPQIEGRIVQVNGTPFTLSLMHTNDTHAHLDNVAKRITAIKEVRAAKPDALLLDAGDVFSGTLYFNEFKGQADLEFMNLAKYDMMTLGNHEFDLGSTPEGHQALAEFIEGADFPIVSSNVNFSDDANLNGLYNDSTGINPAGGEIYNTVIKYVDGQRIGFFGLTTEETAEISSANDVTFEDYIASANAAVDALEAQGVNKIVAITHLGFDDNPAFDNDQLLAANVDGIDVIVGGHSHTQLNAPVVSNKDENGVAKDPTIIVQGYQYSDFLGTLDVTFNKDGVVTGNAGSLIKVADKVADAEAAALLAPYSEQIATVKNTETGATAVTALDNPRSSTDNVRANETRLGNLIADGMLWKAKQFNENVVIAMQNGGGIRAPIDAGPITLGDVLTTLPFGNTLATMTLSGAEIKTALEHSVSQSPKESGGFLHISGMKFTFDSRLPAGGRVKSMKVENEDGSFTEINLNTNYVIATNAFTAKGGDGFDIFKKAYEAGRVTDLGAADWENLRDYVQELVTVNPQIEGRILDDAKAPVDPTGPIEVNAVNFSGTEATPITYDRDVIVTLDNTALLQNAIVKGNLVFEGTTATTEISFLNIHVEGDLDLSNIDSDKVNLDGIQVDGNILF
ncbi:5'-nucleotidase C-terminal domain-containing protein [Paenisporosarcina indica]|uniref:5'-nucleotidase C-terminal domain-containing protein n=1 Tax=Paenisporosarcina indica TaxID=650093 RepID=UPI0009FE71B0|nr:5'-nucleotidase C-terminal domain-containing protein [Paenisporosarcina indica]